MSDLRTLVLHADSEAGERLAARLHLAGEVKVVGTGRPGDGPRLVADLRPDVVLLGFAGAAAELAAIQDMMSATPVPILVLKGDRVDEGAESEARRSGAVDVFPAPAEDDLRGLAGVRTRLRTVSGITVIRHIGGRRPLWRACQVVAIAASTGGPAAVTQLLRGLGGLKAAVLIVQHMHPEFTSNFQEWMARESSLPVAIAADGVEARAGFVYLAPANLHLRLLRDRRLSVSSEPATLHRPSADFLLESVAENAGGLGIGVVLTGMGDDGAAGLLAMRRAGGRTIIQNEASSAVYGMARAAERLGAAEEILALERIPAAILAAVRGRG